ncbi:glycosyltransferase family 4 protein [Cupriavidus basilensis]|uniref:glycosyltransferase family 4 protein n=1 Tax=Cupriavidus basilensis TaxID=68895 RepID=UPI0020A6866E|nr:glycosyltransferase family 4 protein [Cupriavidus basilensis]MCP3018477.1 glycosyltransferase family 4 protein [Cupriavidus basilensis]MDR3384999.1 glycosyltransferase family 4 protein [Cupriavidus basilensis]
MTTPLLYILHSGQLFGTERMAVRTLCGMAANGSGFEGILLAPPGPVHEFATRCGLRSECFGSTTALTRYLWRAFRAKSQLAVAATGLAQSLIAIAMQALHGTRLRHLHIVHGGTDEARSYGRKRLLNPFDVRFVAVSEFVRDRLVAHGIDAARIAVVENFIEPAAVAWRPVFREPGIRRVVTLSRLDRIKRTGLLLQAVRRHPELGSIRFDLYGSGEEQNALLAAATDLPNVRFHGFRPDAADQLRHADLLVHTCPEEPFGLVVLEAFAAGVPVLVPNAGGAGALVRPGETGFHFAANDPNALARALCDLRRAPPQLLNDVAQRARRELSERFDPVRQASRYAQAFGATA